jgi:hypothetical protein
LLSKFGPETWNFGAERPSSRLLKGGTVKEYPVDLYYELDGDRKAMWLYLHRWIFVKAFSELRVKNADNDAARYNTLLFVTGLQTNLRETPWLVQYRTFHPTPQPQQTHQALQ